MTKRKLLSILRRHLKVDYEEGYRGWVVKGIESAATEILETSSRQAKEQKHG